MKAFYSVLGGLLVFVLACTIFYLLGAWLEFNLNPGQWTANLRGLVGSMSLIFGAAGGLITTAILAD